MKFKKFLGLGLSVVMTAASLNVCMAEDSATEEASVIVAIDEITSASAVETDTYEAKNGETSTNPVNDETTSAASEFTPQDDVEAVLADTSHDITYEVTGGSVYIDIVDGEARVADCDGSVTSAVIPESVNYNGDDYKITSIGNYTFFRCTSLTDIKLPDSLTSIGARAFLDCSSLTNIKLPNSLTSIGISAFENCTSLTNITLPDSVTSIGDIGESAFNGCTSLKTAGPIGGGYDYEFGWKDAIPDNAFFGCSSLTYVTFPENLTSIGRSAFEGCSSLANIKLPESITSVGGAAFNGCTSVKTAGPIGGGYDYEFGWKDVIPDYAFYGCTSLTNVNLPEGVTSIGDDAFCNCTSLTNINLPEGVTYIGHDAFFYCTSLADINLPEGITFIGARAFWDCTSLTYIMLPDGITSISDSAFSYCTSLTGIKLPKNLTSIEKRAFCGCSLLTGIKISEKVTYIEEDAFSGCTSVKTAGPIGGGYDYEFGWKNTIPEFAFEGCTSLTYVKLPNSLTSIKSYAFRDCSSLVDITLPDGITSIGDYTFWNCTSLTDINLNEGLTSIGRSAFEECLALESVTIPDSVDSIGSYAFDGCDKLTIYCSSGSYAEAYAIKYNIPYSTEAFHEYIKFTIDGGTINFDKATGEITSFDTNADAYGIVIPDVIDGIMVKAIGANAFADCDEPESVTIPEGVESIGEKAFCNCRNLKSISLPKSVKSIGADAFKGIASGAVVHCYRGSVADNAELYPVGVTISYIEEEIKQGDIDGDGQVTSTDANLALFKSAGIRTLSEAEINIADVDGDGKVTSTDANFILFASAGLRELEYKKFN